MLMVVFAFGLGVLELELAALIVVVARDRARIERRLHQIELRTARCPWCRVPDASAVGTPP